MFFIWFFGLLRAGQSQSPDIGDEKEMYEIYSKQVADLLRVRGLDDSEIKKLLTVYKENDISSNRKMADLLGKLFPVERGLLFIFYQFKNDTLRRVVFEPGSVREQQLIPVKRNELLQLSTDFNHFLGLYEGSDSRIPVQRGVIVKPPPPTKGQTYDQLLHKAAKWLLPDWFNKSYKHIVVIPALNLGTIPFYLLKPYGNAEMLIDHCSYSVAPTIGDLVAIRLKMMKKATSWDGRMTMAFSSNEQLKKMDSATFILENTLFVSNPTYPVNGEYQFPDLPGAKKEIANAIPYARSYVLLQGNQARKDSIFNYLGASDLAYFATHGIASSEDPRNKCYLVLSGPDPYLTTRDIIESRKNFKKFPEMIILSACQTGLGKNMEAGVAGLARAFMLSGAQHVIMSLWNVDDEATAYLMNRFLFHLQEPTLFLPAEPLRKAMLDTRKKFPRPSQWASFSMFGVDY